MVATPGKKGDGGKQFVSMSVCKSVCVGREGRGWEGERPTEEMKKREREKLMAVKISLDYRLLNHLREITSAPTARRCEYVSLTRNAFGTLTKWRDA